MKHYFPKAAPLSPQERDVERRKKSSKKYKGVDVEKSFYYLWFEYLRRSDDYKKACAKMAKAWLSYTKTLEMFTQRNMMIT